MFRADYHLHSYKSYDGDPGASIENIYKTSIEMGLDEIALCEHYDVNWVVTGENPEIDFADSKNRIKKLTMGEPKTRFLLGIELGQPHQCPEKTAEVLEKNDFDFVLCALHNVKNEKDFYYLDYKNTSVSHLVMLFEKYTEELCELANWGEYHALAHITYPVRYFSRNDIDIELEKYGDLYKKLFKIVINRGIALEVNTSGLRKAIQMPCPPFDLLKLYRKEGGELLTVGSDAHKVSDIYSNIPQVCEKLREYGFRYISSVKDKKLVQVKLT